MLVVLHLDDRIRYSPFGQLVSDYTLDASVNLRGEEGSNSEPLKT